MQLWEILVFPLVALSQGCSNVCRQRLSQTSQLQRLLSPDQKVVAPPVSSLLVSFILLLEGIHINTSAVPRR